MLIQLKMNETVLKECQMEQNMTKHAGNNRKYSEPIKKLYLTETTT